MAKAYPKVKMKVSRKKLKGSPKTLGPRKRAGTKMAKTAKSISDTTKTAKQTRSTVGKSHSQEKTASQKAQKAKRTKAKMKAKVKASKPSGVTKASKAIKATKLAGRALGVPGAVATAAQLVGKLPGSGRTSKGGQMKRGKKK